MFLVMAALLGICAPFVEQTHSLRFVVFLVLYPLFLSVFGVGIALAWSSRITSWWIWSGTILVLTFCGITFWLLHGDPGLLLKRIPLLVWSELLLLGAWGLGAIAIAGRGWVRYLRQHSLRSQMRADA